eukprot:1391401-Pyramimonas_sp.AAC.1
MGLTLGDGNHIFVDGSCFEPALPRIRSAGLGVVVTDGWGSMDRAIWGRVPLCAAPAQVARDGEDYVVLSLVRHAAVFPGTCLYGECSGTLGYVQGPSGAVNPENARSHLWQHVHDKLSGVSSVSYTHLTLPTILLV